MNFIPQLRRRWLMLSAKARGKRFYCDALAGRSNYNISINSDMGVSCNCQDYAGEGTIGNLNAQSFPAIWHGETATRFRQELAAGVLPITTCTACRDLRMVFPEEAQRQLTEIAAPSRGMMLENTALCNLACTSCKREVYYENRKVKSMTLTQLEQAAALMGQLGVKLISFFKLGEPFLSSNVNLEMAVVRKHNPLATVMCSTAGMLMTPAKFDAALRMTVLFISLDGIDTAMCRRYQRKQDFDRVYANMRALVCERSRRGLERPVICWKYVLFRWNDAPAHIEKAIAMAKDARVDYLVLTPTIIPPTGLSWRYHLGLMKRYGPCNEEGIRIPIAATPEHETFMEGWLK